MKVYNILDWSNVLIATIQQPEANIAIMVYNNFGHYYGVYAVEAK